MSLHRNTLFKLGSVKLDLLKTSLTKPHPQGRLATQVKSPVTLEVLTHAVIKFDFMMFKIVQ